MLMARTADMGSLVASAVLSIFFCLTFTAADNQHCVDVNNDVIYKVDEIEGTWYPVDIVLHRNDSKIYGVPLDTQCPAVTFSRDPRNKRILLMVWNSTEGDLEYRFTQKGRGQWQATLEQKGSSSPAQEQLQGLKASILAADKDRYMILRLCSTSIHSSVILSRQNTRSADVLNMANTELAQLAKFPAYERKPMCNSGALGSSLTSSVLAIIFVVVLLLRV